MSFYVGKEFHRTMAQGQETLFVEGYYNTATICATALNNVCPHIHLGYNGSFAPTDINDVDGWEKVIHKILEDQIWLTLSFSDKYAQDVWEMNTMNYSTFIPLMKIELPYVNRFNYNTTVAITDDQKMVNEGIWYHRLHDLKSTDKFLHHTRYGLELEKVDPVIIDTE